MRTSHFAVAGLLLGAVVLLQSTAQATTYIEARGSNGNERCLVGAESFGESGQIGKTCKGGGSYDGQASIVDLIIADIGGSLSWERVNDPLDSLFTYLSSATQTTQVQGRARYAGYGNTFGATIDGNYHELIGTAPNGQVLLTSCTGITNCQTIGASSEFVELDSVISGLTSGDVWKPTLNVQGLGTTFYTSLAADNFGGLDHMVAFKTVNPVNNVPSDGFQAFRYIIGFEDLANLGDLDYNDYVVEILFSAVSNVPEPGTLALFGAGLFGLSRLRRRPA